MANAKEPIVDRSPNHEAVLREAFEGMGFGARKTRSSKDGGFDLELTISEGGKRLIFLVEVKHWTDQRPGSGHLKKLIKVTLSKEVEGSFLLSSSGFTKTVYSGITEISVPVRLGAGEKIVALCRTYYRLKNQLWRQDVNLHQELLSGTWAIGDTPCRPSRSWEEQAQARPRFEFPRMSPILSRELSVHGQMLRQAVF